MEWIPSINPLLIFLWSTLSSFSLLLSHKLPINWVFLHSNYLYWKMLQDQKQSFHDSFVIVFEDLWSNIFLWNWYYFYMLHVGAHKLCVLTLGTIKHQKLSEMIKIMYCFGGCSKKQFFIYYSSEWCIKITKAYIPSWSYLKLRIYQVALLWHECFLTVIFLERNLYQLHSWCA